MRPLTHHPLTFLFTDLVGSSRLWEQFPAEMRPALERHDTLLKEAVETSHGRIVKTTGDGLHAVFEAPSDGVAAALAGQQAIGAETWPAATGHLKVRMGLHTGEGQERDGDFYGPALNRAARIMSVGHGGQVLLSGVTRALARDSLPTGATLLDLGEHSLRDLSQPEHLYQLCHPGLASDFPPLKSLSAYKHNLPVQLTNFIGREKELAKIKQFLSQTRLLTLLGPGGTGKTRLAIQTAADLVDQFPDGVWLVELAPLSDPDLIAERISTTLNVHEQGNRPTLDNLTNFLQRKELLLLLDNVEHLVRESAELTEDLLTKCPSIRILVTGREALFIGGETTLQIPSLSLPDKADPTLEIVAGSEAVQLFLARARAVRPDFDLTPANAPALAEVVRRLDGIPLALELAASRLRMMSVEQIAANLADRFRILTGGSRTALPRQQTLQALIDWSWNLLEEQEQVLLRRLSVFSGGWTLEASQAIASDPELDEISIYESLDQLINKSLVKVEYLPKGEVRYTLLESIRQYATDRLLASGEGEALRNRHAEYMVAFGEEASRAVEGPDALIWLDRLVQEADNAAAAREWALESRLDLALKMTGVSMLVLRYWLFSPEGFRWLAQVVELARLRPPKDPDLEYQRGLAAAITAYGATIFMQGKNAQARPILEEGIALAKEAGAVRQQVFGLTMLLSNLLNSGDFDTAKLVAEEALDISRQHDLVFLRQVTLGRYMPMFASQGKYDQAHDYAKEAVRLAQQHGNPWMVAMASFLKGRVEESHQDWAAAAVSFSKATELFEAVRDRPFALICLTETGHNKRRLGDFGGAREIYLQTIIQFQDWGHNAAVAHQLECMGMIAIAQKQSARAAQLLGAAQALRETEESSRHPLEQIEYDQTLTDLAAEMGEAARDAALDEGRSLGADEAVDLALRVDTGAES